LHGRKEEALAFAEVALPKGYQVMAIDLPIERTEQREPSSSLEWPSRDGRRQSQRKPWEVLPLLNEVRDYLYENWQSVSVRANSIGSRFSLLAFQNMKVEQALLASPILDMKKFIELMPQRENDYYEWVVNNPITRNERAAWYKGMVSQKCQGCIFIERDRPLCWFQNCKHHRARRHSDASGTDRKRQTEVSQGNRTT
jgi:hypothetical protein